MYSYVLNNPLNLLDPNGLDCAYLTDNGIGVEEIDHNSDIGECQANGGYWANGWIANSTWVQTNPFNNNVLIYSQFSNGGLGVSIATQTWTQGAFGLSDEATFSLISFKQWAPQGYNQKAMLAIHNGLQYLPAVCSLSASARFGPGKASAGVQLSTDLASNTSLRAVYRAQAFSLGPLAGSISGNGANLPSATVSVRIPDTPVSIGVTTPDGNTISGVQVSARVNGLFNITAGASLANAYQCPQPTPAPQ